ncbi:2OG-Fe(II) oxygenase [Acinetobacter sp. ANC 4654]|uniref:alpha-ketoglutarate-dependent dioxygenase AlkB n=1 Tax=Acinetobacter sp. ANC 4654 TaxID=1977872 RepID=UPI000A338A64|nr:alpha-ketoglutarate-dependent dioxygenase AlkB [Acinetobacter sp. ANC 4654]OTG92721.1 2OG-Fe(II) oxygenase [Acinetobacter sp. ANC 4654]
MDTADLFGEFKPEPIEVNILGLEYLSDFLSREQEEGILNHIDQQPWITELDRRVQHYGARYDYKKGNLDRSQIVPKIPSFLNKLVYDLIEECGLSNAPDQLIINEYLPGQGIFEHVDSPSAFQDTIIMISLNSTCVMDFIPLKEEYGEKVSLLLERGSLLKVQDDARYKWKHAIPKRKKDIWQSHEFIRQRRVSLTFRHILNK